MLVTFGDNFVFMKHLLAKLSGNIGKTSLGQIFTSAAGDKSVFNHHRCHINWMKRPYCGTSCNNPVSCKNVQFKLISSAVICNNQYFNAINIIRSF